MNQIATQQPGVATLPAVPDYLLQRPDLLGNNDVIKAGVGSTYQAPARISIEGRVFHVIKNGEDRPITIVDQQTGQIMPVPSLDMAIIGANAGKYKTFYGSKYDPKAVAERPRCYSYDGITPSPYGDDIQAPSCAVCNWNKFGSMVNDLGNETKACSDAKIIAVIPAHAITQRLAHDAPGGDAFSMKVSATALSRSREERKADPANNTSLAEYLALLDKYPTGQNTAVAVSVMRVMTRFYFEMNAKYPLLRFRLAKFLTADEAAYIAARAEGDDVKAIVEDPGAAFAGVPATPSTAAAALPAPTFQPPAATLPAPIAPAPAAAFAPAPVAAAPAPLPPTIAAAIPSFAPAPAAPAALAAPAMTAAPQNEQWPGQGGAAPATRGRGRPKAGVGAAQAAPAGPGTTQMAPAPMFPGMMAPAAAAPAPAPVAAQMAPPAAAIVPTTAAQDEALAAAMAAFDA